MKIYLKKSFVMINLCIVGLLGFSQFGCAEDGSAAARKKGDIAISVQSFLSNFGLAADYYASKDNLVELAGGSDMLPWVNYEKIGLKTFHGNSFYTTQSIITFTGLGNDQRHYGVDLNLGNEWQWHCGFKFGIDWLGAIFRLTREKIDLDDEGSDPGIFRRPELWNNIKPYALRFRLGHVL